MPGDVTLHLEVVFAALRHSASNLSHRLEVSNANNYIQTVRAIDSGKLLYPVSRVYFPAFSIETLTFFLTLDVKE